MEYKQRLSEYTFIAVKNGESLTSKERGIKPVLYYLKQSPDFLKGAKIYDRVVGKAAAMLFDYAGVKDVYAITISRAAAEYFDLANIKYECEKMPDRIVNRAGDGLCPMEERAMKITDKSEAFSTFNKIIEV